MCFIRFDRFLPEFTFSIPAIFVERRQSLNTDNTNSGAATDYHQTTRDGPASTRTTGAALVQQSITGRRVGGDVMTSDRSPYLTVDRRGSYYSVPRPIARYRPTEIVEGEKITQ